MIPGILRIDAQALHGGHAGGGIVEMLRADHAQLNALFDRFIAVARNESPPLPAVRERLARCICEALSAQRAAEQEVLYPDIRKESDKLVFAFLLADESIAMRIAEIRDPAAPQLERDLAVHRLIAMMRRYMLEREQVLIPFLQTRLSATRMQWLGADFAQRKLAHATGNAAAMPAAPEVVAGDLSADPAIGLLAWRKSEAGEDAGKTAGR